MKVVGVYAIVNVITGERYVGSSRDVARRFSYHRCTLRQGHNKAQWLQAAWNLHGEAAFRFVLLFECSKKNLLKLEQAELDKGAEYNLDKTARTTRSGKVYDPAVMAAKQSAAWTPKRKAAMSKITARMHKVGLLKSYYPPTTEGRLKMSLAAKEMQQRRKEAQR